MANGAERPVPIDDGLDLHGVRHVLCRWTVTDFAGYAPVVRSAPDRLHVPMAEGALLTPGVGLLEVPDGVHRCGSVVPELPEGVGYEEVPGDEEGRTHQRESDEKTRDLLRHAVHPFRWQDWCYFRRTELEAEVELSTGEVFGKISADRR